MRKYFAVAVLVITNALTVTAATRTEKYVYHGEPSSVSTSAMYDQKVNIAVISDEGDYWSLDCFGAGTETCSWQAAACPLCIGIYTPFGDPNSLYNIGTAADLIKYAETQIVNGTYSGIHHANIIIGSNTYYRTVNWSYNTTYGNRDCNVIITEVTP